MLSNQNLFSNFMGRVKTSTGFFLVAISLFSYLVLFENFSLMAATCPKLIGNVTITKTPASCNNADGSAIIDISALGGTAPYSLSLAGQTNTSGNFGSLAAGKYLLRVSDNSGCKDSIYITIASVGGIQAPSFSTASPSTCFGADGKVIISNTTGTGPFSYLLSNSATGNSASGNFVFNSVSVGEYSLTITDGAGCKFTIDGLQVTNEIKPGGNCSAGFATTIFEGESAFIGGNCDGVAAWDSSAFLSSLNISNPTATPPSGIHTFTMHCINESTCTECVDEVTITVLKEIVPPNTFTPNGDGDNDVWVIAGLDIYDDCELWVYTRWGQRVFHQNGYKSGAEWNGTNHGLVLPPATYYYIIDIKRKDTEGKPKKYAGSITIIK